MSDNGFLQKRVPPWLIWFLVVTASVFVGNLLQSQVHLNHDVSWIAHSARWLLRGQTFGTGVLDPNPPMAWFLSMPAAGLAELGLMPEPSAVRLVFWGYFFVSAALLFRVLSDADPREQSASTGWKLAFVVVSTLAPGFSFGQREYVSVLFAMPYLASAAVILGRRGTAGLATPGRIAVGVLAGVGFAIKPYFLAVPLLVEGLLVARLGWRSLFRTESVLLGATILAYLAAVVVFAPQYLQFTVPLMRSVYWAFETAGPAILIKRFAIVAQPALYGALIALLSRSWSSQHTVILLGGLGYAFSYFIQAKGFVYHSYPVLVCAIAFLGVSLGSGLGHVWTARQSSPRWVPYALIPAMILLTLPPLKQAHDAVVDWYAEYNVAWGRTGVYREVIISIVDRLTPSPKSYFFAFSTHPFPAFPTASYTGAEFSGRSAAQGIVAAYARRDEVADPALKANIVRAAHLQRRMVVEDLELRPPTIVFAERSRSRLGTNGRPFDDLAFYLEDPQFSRIWSAYEEYPPIGPLRVFVRRGEGAQPH